MFSERHANAEDWHRIGDFFYTLNSNVRKHFVAFRQMSTIPTIRSISVCQYTNNEIVVHLEIPIFKGKLEELLTLCRTRFHANDIEQNSNYGNIIKLRMNSEKNAVNLIQMLIHLNKKYARTEYTSALIEDLKQILAKQLAIAEANQLRKHVIPLQNETVIEKIPMLSPKSTLNIKKLLTQGYANKGSGYIGFKLLVDALLNADEQTLKLVLNYGVSPFLPYFDGLSPACAFEVACESENTTSMQLMLNSCANKMNLEPLNADASFYLLPKSIQKPLLSISGFDIGLQKNRIKTQLKTTLPIQIELCQTSELSKEEMHEIWELYQTFFEESPVIENNLEHFYLSEFVGKSKFVEKFMLDGQLQGISLYEIVTDEADKDTIFLHISCIFMKESLRGKGLTNPLVFSLAFALQQLFPEKNIICVYQAISAGSACLVKDLTYYFPKFVTTLDKFAEMVIHHIQPKPSKVEGDLLVKEPMCCYSEIEVQNKQENKEHKFKSIYEEFFEYLRKRENAQENEGIHRGVLYMVLTSDELFKQYADLCIRMHLNPLQYIEALAKSFCHYTNSQSGMSKNLYVPKSKPFYFNGVRELVSASSILEQRKTQRLL